MSPTEEIRAKAAGYSAGVYGSILAAALVGAMFEDSAGPRSMTLSLAASIVIFWIAHAWSEVIGERVAVGPRFEPSRIRALAAHEWPLVESGMLPAIALALAWVGLYSRDTGVTLALVVCILHLMGWGVLAGHRTQPSWSGALLVGAIDGALGLGIVAIEIAIHRI
jgi:hypothetical protein